MQAVARALRDLVGMAKKKNSVYYAVARGRQVGIFRSWPECEAQVKGASGAKYKGFPTHDQAHEYIKQLNWDYKVQHEKAQRQLPPSTPVQSSSGNGSSSQDAIIVDDEEGEPLEQEAGPSRHRESDSNQEDCSELKKQIVSGKVSSGKKAKREKNSRRIAALEESLRQASERIAALESGSQQSSGYDTTLDVKSKSSSIRSAAQLDVGSSQTSKRSAVSGASSYQSKKKPRINVDSQESSSSPCTDLVVHKSSQVRTIEVYTDGACTDNGKYSARAGWGVYWPEGQGDDLIGLNESKRLPGNRSQQTNNRAEFMGLIRAVQLCPDPDAQLVIYTDSAYCINAIEKWQGNWRRNGWLLSSTQTPVLNKDLIRLLERELRGRRLRPILRKVKGHSNNKGNCMADKLAVRGKNLEQSPPHTWPDYEPPPSDDESDEQNYEKAVQMWHNLGLTIEKAREKAGPPPP